MLKTSCQRLESRTVSRKQARRASPRQMLCFSFYLSQSELQVPQKVAVVSVRPSPPENPTTSGHWLLINWNRKRDEELGADFSSTQTRLWSQGARRSSWAHWGPTPHHSDFPGSPLRTARNWKLGLCSELLLLNSCACADWAAAWMPDVLRRLGESCRNRKMKSTSGRMRRSSQLGSVQPCLKNGTHWGICDNVCLFICLYGCCQVEKIDKKNS